MELSQQMPQRDEPFHPNPHTPMPAHYTPSSPVHTPRSPLSGSESPRESQDGWSKSGSSSQPHTPRTSPQGRQNQVSQVLLHGVMIVSLNIDAKERLCLAQISNTLLKDYSYNEIHNRRVALGITCVQCTPVQLEILRRAGAMPVSSRRCGMITKREAERLVKSFLEDAEPPKLPDDFAFQVVHECGWGCHGFFEPARYNSSRAKCIKCGYCSVYFSPNKFIFHFHRTPDAKYHHPDAANFNSWRRHLKLAGGSTDDEQHVWEDVKAMFNGGTRKRIFSTSARSSSSHSAPVSSMSTRSDASSSSSSLEAKKKTPKLPHSGDLQVAPKHPFPAPNFHPYPWGYGPGTKPSYPFVSVNTSQSLCFGFPHPGGPKENVGSEGNSLLKGAMSPLSNPWLGRASLPFSNLADAFWDKTFGLPRPLGAAGMFRANMYPPVSLHAKSPGQAGGMGRVPEGHGEDCKMDEEVDRRHMERRDSSSRDGEDRADVSTSGNNNTSVNQHSDRFSAFRLVGRNIIGNSNNNNDTKVLDEDLSESDVGDADETEEIDVTEEDCCSPQDLSLPELREGQNESRQTAEKEEVGRDADPKEHGDADSNDEPAAKRRRLSADDVTVNDDAMNEEDENQQPTEENREVDADQENRPEGSADNSADESDVDQDGSLLQSMSKEELCHTLQQELCNRKKKEKEVTVLKETFHEEVSREKAFRDQMARQLEILRETLTNELEQERNVRFSLQQKLKEAHDALQNFSCSMMTAAKDYNMTEQAAIPR